MAHACKTCGRSFASLNGVIDHERMKHEQPERFGGKRPPRRLDIETASDIADDLPDGAYWALMEELTGMDPGEIAEADMNKRRKGRPA